MVHEGARLLSLATGLPLVIDFRDPWQLTVRLPEAIAHPVWLRLAVRYERRVVQRASLAIVNTDPCRVAMQAVYPDAHDRILTVMNGYDEDPLPPSSPERRFRVAYAGSILLDRSPRTLFRAAAQVVRELRLTPEDFSIEFLGDVVSHDGLTIDLLAEQEGLRGFVRVLPTRHRREALEFLGRASLLVSLPQDTHLAIPSKIFEYLRFDAPILALAEKGSATELVLHETRARVLPPADVLGIANVIAACYKDRCAGRRPSGAVNDDRLSRRVQAQKLFAAIEELVP
ncbi:MAG: hypothetical protein AUI63_00270 [Gemmatimonadetes bacterium 13_1_40CM_2_60_3]|nr:MAG: hypothetical protein AUI63_00270 [Gemmatimonadetes bacterium 13_1_40CM_2_60_3]